MKIIKIIESKRWINNITKHTASIYGSVPYANKTERQNWSIQVVGYTWQLDNGTIGLGRRPAKTIQEAIKIMNEFNGTKP